MFKMCLGCVWNLLWLCFGLSLGCVFKNVVCLGVFGICLNVWNVFVMCLGCVWDVFG